MKIKSCLCSPPFLGWANYPGILTIQEQLYSDAACSSFHLQSFYLAWWLCRASSDQTPAVQAVSLSRARRGSVSQTGTSMCYLHIWAGRLRKSRATSQRLSNRWFWSSICSRTVHGSDCRCDLNTSLPDEAPFIVPKVWGKGGKKLLCSDICVMTSSKVAKGPFSCDNRLQ